MLKIEIPDVLREQLADAIKSLADSTRLEYPAVIASEVCKFYAQQLPEIFADNTVEFFRERTHAKEIARTTDAYATLVGLRTHAITLQTAAATPENVAWLNQIFQNALTGNLHLRTQI